MRHSPKNDYDADEEVPLEDLEGAGLRWMSIVVVMMVVAGFFALAWYAYHSSNANDGSGELVRAEEGPVKVKPADPGGMKTPYQDMSVYNVISENGGPKKEHVEQLLPEPEEPMVNREDPPAQAARKHEDMKVWIRDEGDVDSEEEKDAPAEVKLLPPPPAKEDAPEENGDASESDGGLKIVRPKRFMEKDAELHSPTVATPKPKEDAPVAPKVEPAPLKQVPAAVTKQAAPAPVNESGSTQLQLAALKTPAEATATWNQIRKKHSDLLAGKQYLIVKADLPQGTFYRLRISGLSASAAKQLCDALTARRQSCMVIR
jgi:hypothetical protein